jgi:sugar phosphate isomerase/epimerase
MATGGCVDRPILEVLRQFGEAGFHAVEIGTPPKHFDPWQKGQVDAVADHLRRTGIAVVSIHAPFGGILDLSDPNPHHRSAAIGGIMQAASVLRELGGSIVVVHPSDVPRDSQDVGQRLEASAGTLAVLAHSCWKMGLRLAIESPLPHLIGGDPTEFAWLLEHVDQHVGVCLDTSHTFLGQHWAEFLKVAGSRLIHVHACDNRGSFDDHLPPGEGVIDWREVAESLRRVSYDGWIVLEIACMDASNGRLTQIRQTAERLFG